MEAASICKHTAAVDSGMQAACNRPACRTSAALGAAALGSASRHDQGVTMSNVVLVAAVCGPAAVGRSMHDAAAAASAAAGNEHAS